jgi:predicted RNA-binding protein associated with RNAse of E/G family
VKTAQKVVDEVIASKKWENCRKSAIASAIQFFNDPYRKLDFKSSEKDHVVVKSEKTRKVVHDAYYLEINKLNEMSKRRVRFSTQF